jgi:molybdopterin converting factor small subunit
VSTVTVQLFASYAELLGASKIEISLAPDSTVNELLQRIRLLPGASMLPAAPRLAVNRSFASADLRIQPDDEIALIPPVAGG